MNNYIENAANTVPSQRQYEWNKLEFYSFIHFGINQFTNREWGLGNEDPAIFNPVNLDADQWAEAVKSAGMKGLILTAKHHDGFCLWPSKYTEHSVKNSPYKNGKGDIVKEASEACKKAGIKFGIYLSPWDRNSAIYGTSGYNDYYINQLTELLTGYGELFCIWLDGACGEGPNGKKQVYDFDRYYQTVRKYQPNACICICGPDVRWCGNEAGSCRKNEWSVVPADKELNITSEDLGSRDKISDSRKFKWYPAEVDTSIRPGWFYHAEEDDKVRSFDELIRIYYNSVGGNASLLLNIPPDKRGLLHENDVKRLKEIGDYLKKTFADDIAKGCPVISDSSEDSNPAANITDGNEDTYWMPKDYCGEASVIIDLKGERKFSHVVLMENIRKGQRIESFNISVSNDCKNFKTIHENTVVGYKRICRFDEQNARYIKICITNSRICPTLRYAGVF
jgi:alpha-L-fucosidase